MPVEPATELARHMPLFPSRLELPSPDKSSAAGAGFGERVLLPVFQRLGPDGASSAVRPVLDFSSAVSVDNRTVPSSAHQHTLHPHRHPPAHFPRPHSNHTPVAHPSVWPWQAKIGPSTLSFAMFWVSIVAFSARCASKCAHIFMNVHCASVRSVAVSSPGPGMVGPGEL